MLTKKTIKSLTKKELSICECYASDYTEHDITHELNIKPETLTAYKYVLWNKLGIGGFSVFEKTLNLINWCKRNIKKLS